MRRSAILLILAVIGLMGCTPGFIGQSSQPETAVPFTPQYAFPPGIYVLVDGERSSEAVFIMVEEAGGSIVDYDDPDPLAEAVVLDSNEVILEIDGSLPESMRMSLNNIKPDGTTARRDDATMELMPTEQIIRWSTQVAPGRYLLTMGVTNVDDRDASYWLVVEFK